MSVLLTDWIQLFCCFQLDHVKVRVSLLALRADAKLQWQHENPEENPEESSEKSPQEPQPGGGVGRASDFLWVIQLFTYRWHTWHQLGCVLRINWWYIEEWRLWEHICVSLFTYVIHPSIYYCQKVSKMNHRKGITERHSVDTFGTRN